MRFLSSPRRFEISDTTPTFDELKALMDGIKCMLMWFLLDGIFRPARTNHPKVSSLARSHRPEVTVARSSNPPLPHRIRIQFGVLLSNFA